MKIKKIILFLALAIFTVIPSKKNNTQAQVYFSQIDSEDTFASELYIHNNCTRLGISFSRVSRYIWFLRIISKKTKYDLINCALF